MAGHRESPRQKMISMMYMVLTALLALNVSKEVLNAFAVVNDSVLLTNENFSQKLRTTYSNFERNFNLNQNEVRPFWDKAKMAQKLSADLVDYIENLRNELISVTERIPIDSASKVLLLDLQTKDDYTVPTHFFMGGSDDGTRGRSAELKNKIEEYRANMLNLVDTKYRDNVNIGLETDGEYYDASGKKQNWQLHHFYEIPLAADIPILNKIITEVYNAEFDVVNALLNAISAEDFKYDKIEAKVLSKSNFLFIGERYEAEVIVAAYDTSQSPQVFIMRGVDSLPVSRKEQATLVTSSDGRIRLNFPTGSPGSEKFAGFVSVKTGSGNENTYHFKNEYTVARPSLTVSATKMNVLYAEVRNPISISVSGIPRQNIFPVISCGTLQPDPTGAGWIATIPSGYREATIQVNARLNEGVRNMGSETFRVKNLPDPVPHIANRKEGFVSKEILIAAATIAPKMPDDFEFDYSFNIVSFRLTMQRGFNVYHYDSESAQLTDEMIVELRKTNRGQNLLFENIVARGPDGTDRQLQPIAITIN